MQMDITFRHLDPIDSLKMYAQDKVDRAVKYLDHAGKAHVVLSLERHLHNADISISAGPFVLRGRVQTPDMYASIDLAMDKIERQLRRYKEKLKHHHGKDRVHHRQHLLAQHSIVEVPPPEAHDNLIDGAHRVIRSNEVVAFPMSVEEAVMQMDLMNNDFLIYTNSTTSELNVLYRRKDGHYGLIEQGAVKKSKS